MNKKIKLLGYAALISFIAACSPKPPHEVLSPCVASDADSEDPSACQRRAPIMHKAFIRLNI